MLTDTTQSAIFFMASKTITPPAENKLSYIITENTLIIYTSRELQEIIKYLITKNADVNQRYGVNGDTPLFVGVRSKSLQVVDELLKAGADVNHKNKQGYTPLLVAATKGSIDIIGKLVEKGAEINAQVNMIHSILVGLLEVR